MSRQHAFIRKVVYIAAIAVLLLVLPWISQPAVRTTRSTTTEEGGGQQQVVSPGGVLARMRAEHNLSQAELGEIDPAGETMKLATLGMRGVAANALWEQANYYKKTENWDQLAATLNQIIKLQPNFVTVWEFQAHNLAYNVSVEFDDYRHRYEWVKKGVDFLIRGTAYNRNEARLVEYVGWIIGQKIGRADEHRQFRRIFREDEDFHNVMTANGLNIEEARYGNVKGYDNWLMSRLWYLKAEALVARLENEGRPGLKKKNPLIFYSNAPMSLINYASAYVKEFEPGEVAQFAWNEALKRWREFGRRPIRTSLDFDVTMLGLDEARQHVKKLQDELDALAPGVRASLQKSQRDLLQREVPEMYEALVLYEKAEDPFRELTPEQVMMGQEAASAIHINHLQVAEKAPSATRAAAKRKAAELIEAAEKSRLTDSYRDVINYSYWETRCEAEATDEATIARLRLYEAQRLLEQAIFVRHRVLDENGRPIPKTDPDTGMPIVDEEGKPVFEEEDGAKEKFEAAWNYWASVFDRYPQLWGDVTAEDLVEPIRQYRSMLQQMGQKELPRDFKLMTLLDIRGGQDGLPTSKDIEATYAEEDSSSESSTPPASDKPASSEDTKTTEGDAVPSSTEEDTKTPTDDVPSEGNEANKPPSDEPAPVDERPASDEGSSVAE